MEFHEVANLFPMMTPDEFAGLKEDIDRNGQIDPVWIHDGKIIDGRNRYLACTELGIEPLTREWNGDGDLVGLGDVGGQTRVLSQTYPVAFQSGGRRDRGRFCRCAIWHSVSCERRTHPCRPGNHGPAIGLYSCAPASRHWHRDQIHARATA